MYIDFLLDVFRNNKENTAIIRKDKVYTYNWLLNRISYWETDLLKKEKINAGEVVALVGDFSPECIALLLALIQNGNSIVPLNNSTSFDYTQKFEIARVEKIITVADTDEVSAVQVTGTHADHPYYQVLRKKSVPGLVLFTSGTSGLPKAAVHDFSKLLEKFKNPRKALKTVNFLMFDHWGGLNTMFHTLFNAGVVLATKDRAPEAICAFIEKYRIELLPASPTFFNLLMISEVYSHYDLSSLKVITYGTEPMPEFILKKLKNLFPDVKLQQTYGLIELGVLRSKSKDDASLWVKVGGEGYETRIVDNILQIKADSAMLGYLNAPSPFTEDGWFITGDSVEVDGEYIKILGRKSELINVGGEKVYPQEVENIILQMDNVEDITVYGEKNAFTGNIVCARVSLKQPEDKKEFTQRLKKYCAEKMKTYMIPVKVVLEENVQISDRFKKIRHR